MDIPQRSLIFSVNERPPWLVSIVVAIQHLIGCFGGIATVTVTLSGVICTDIDSEIRSRLFCSSLFIVGFATVINTAFGIRLPVFQGPSTNFILPLMILKNSGEWTCPDPSVGTGNDTIVNNTHNIDVAEITYRRINEIQGSLMIGALLEVFIGATGLCGLVTRVLGPIPIGVAIMLLGISLYPVPVYLCNVYWPVSIFVTAALVLFAMYLAPIRVQFPRFCMVRSASDFKYPIFEGLSVLFSISLGWILSTILTHSGVFTDDPSQLQFKARTDTRVELIKSTPWFIMPYPGQFGMPRFNTAIVIGYLALFLASAMESVGDYYALSSICDVHPPPRHAVNRGIMVEGLLSIISGSLGIGHATTSYTANVVIIELTKVGSRTVFILAGFICMIFGVIGKIGAFMSSLPEPVIGGLALYGTGIAVAIGISSLQKVDISSSRNLSVIGLSLFTGIVSYEWLNKNQDLIHTGNKQYDQIIYVILGNPMLIGGLMAILLDNTVRGTDKDRGINSNIPMEKDDTIVSFINNDDKPVKEITTIQKRQKCYDFPGMHRFQRKLPFLRYMPFLQPYRD